MAEPLRRHISEYIIERPGMAPKLDYNHHHLWRFKDKWKSLESLALKSEPIEVKVSDIVAIGNHHADHYTKEWQLRDERDIPEELMATHKSIRSKIDSAIDHLKQIPPTILNQSIKGKGGELFNMRHWLISAVVGKKPIRLVELPEGKYAVVGGADKTSVIKLFKLKTAKAHVVRLADLVEELASKK